MSRQLWWDDDVDFLNVYADDEYLDDLGGVEEPEPLDELAELLLSWRYAVDAVPIGELVETQLAVAIVWAALARLERGECA